MKLSEFKNHLNTADEINFVLPGGRLVPSHFHITEVGQLAKNFIDCGGTVRTEKTVCLQLWEANDYNHRLQPQKLLKIIALSEKALGIEDHEVEVEYQSDTIGKYGLAFNGVDFELTPKQTTCLAQDQCGLPQAKRKLPLAELQACKPGSGCC